MAVSKEQLHHWFTFHPPTPGQNAAYEELRDRGLALAEAINDHCPESSDTQEAIRRVREAVMFANAAIALHQPRTAGSSR